VPAIIIALYCIIEMKAFKRSTHKIEYMPVPVPDIGSLTERQKKEEKEFKEGFNKDMMDDFIV
jgi:hypothetical protein